MPALLMIESDIHHYVTFSKTILYQSIDFFKNTLKYENL